MDGNCGNIGGNCGNMGGKCGNIGNPQGQSQDGTPGAHVALNRKMLKQSFHHH